MSSSKLILIFLGFIFLIIVILSSNRIAGALRTRLGKYIPGIKVAKISPSPTPTSAIEEEIPTPTTVYGETKGGFAGTPATSSPTGEIPATGPAGVTYLILGGSLMTGLALKKITGTLPRK